MSNKIVLRVISKAGRSRIEIDPSSSFAQLRDELHQRLHVEPNQLQLYLDEKNSKKLLGRDSDTISSLKLKNGDMIYVAN